MEVTLTWSPPTSPTRAAMSVVVATTFSLPPAARGRTARARRGAARWRRARTKEGRTGLFMGFLGNIRSGLRRGGIPSRRSEGVGSVRAHHEEQLQAELAGVLPAIVAGLPVLAAELAEL